MPADRDRRPDGRPENARPRDRTGRPLPYGTADVPLTEEHEPTTVEEALDLGMGLWSQQRLFEAHECLEFVWHAAPPAERELWQGIIQVAVAGVHLQRDNPEGAVAMLAKARRKLVAYPQVHRGVRVGDLVGFCDTATVELTRDPEAVVAVPALPVAPGGPWFTGDPARSARPTVPTPIDPTPPWRRPPRGDADDAGARP